MTTLKETLDALDWLAMVGQRCAVLCENGAYHGVVKAVTKTTVTLQLKARTEPLMLSRDAIKSIRPLLFDKEKK